MAIYDKKYPGYGFTQHKGYATSQHLNALYHLGPCPIHRQTFSPVIAAAKSFPQPLLALFSNFYCIIL